jgi:hypothetical protein
MHPAPLSQQRMADNRVNEPLDRQTDRFK